MLAKTIPETQGNLQVCCKITQSGRVQQIVFFPIRMSPSALLNLLLRIVDALRCRLARVDFLHPTPRQEA